MVLVGIGCEKFLIDWSFRVSAVKGIGTESGSCEREENFVDV